MWLANLVLTRQITRAGSHCLAQKILVPTSNMLQPASAIVDLGTPNGSPTVGGQRSCKTRCISETQSNAILCQTNRLLGGIWKWFPKSPASLCCKRPKKPLTLSKSNTSGVFYIGRAHVIPSSPPKRPVGFAAEKATSELWTLQVEVA